MQHQTFSSSNPDFLAIQGGTLSSFGSYDDYQEYGSSVEDEKPYNPVELRPAGNVWFLADYLNKKVSKNDLLLELEDIQGSIDEFKSDGIDLNLNSIEDSIYFATNYQELLSSKLPVVEFNPNGDIALTWRKRSKGILNIAFNGCNVVTWAAYLEAPQEQSLNGRFKLKDGAPFSLEKILEIIID